MALDSQLEAPEPKEKLEAAPDEVKLEPAPKELELESVPAPAELPATPSVGALPKPKKSKKGLVIALVVVLLVACAACASYFLFFNKSEDKPADTKKEETSKQDEEPKKEEEAKNKTYTTQYNKLSFDYPDSWKVTGETDSYDGRTNYFTTVESPTGYKLYLSEANYGGVGGACDPETAPLVQVHKEADTKISGVAVVSGVMPNDGGFSIRASIFTGPYDSPVSDCSVKFDGLIQQKISTDSILVRFSNTAPSQVDALKRPSDAEYQEVVKILSSLRQEK
ncbi:MAG: hypothetical protein LBL84_01530 [Candidatus Nomurabacteria bacterium]|jgi:hypothetical protein|nr:hypothetical protein [Candidatus Nomurabacteria bacterium]